LKKRNASSSKNRSRSIDISRSFELKKQASNIIGRINNKMSKKGSKSRVNDIIDEKLDLISKIYSTNGQ
jgi:ribosomal protein S7